MNTQGCISISIYQYVYIYIYRERERGWKRKMNIERNNQIDTTNKLTERQTDKPRNKQKCRENNRHTNINLVKKKKDLKWKYIVKK